MKLLLCWLLLTSVAFADDVAVCDPTSQPVANAVTRFERTIDGESLKERSSFLVWQAPHNLMTEVEQARMNTRRSQFDALVQVPVRYWKCRDTDADGLLDAVGEMTQAEQDAVDAPVVAAQQQQQADTADLATLASQLQALYDGLTQNQKDSVQGKLLRIKLLEQRLGR